MARRPSLVIPADVDDRADALTSPLTDDPRLAGAMRRDGRPSKAAVMRLALSLGLALLEEQASPAS